MTSLELLKQLFFSPFRGREAALVFLGLLLMAGSAGALYVQAGAGAERLAWYRYAPLAGILPFLLALILKGLRHRSRQADAGAD
jgi:hypothetical protein